MKLTKELILENYILTLDLADENIKDTSVLSFIDTYFNVNYIFYL